MRVIIGPQAGLFHGPTVRFGLGTIFWGRAGRFCLTWTGGKGPTVSGTFGRCGGGVVNASRFGT